MHPHRKKRLTAILFIGVGFSLALLLTLTALNKNLDFFYDPAMVLAGEAPVQKRIRVGGMVSEGSVARAPDDQTKVVFRVSNLQGDEVLVIFQGILPDLFREGAGVVAVGMLDSGGVFHAEEVLAKHDENYMPPEVAAAMEGSQTQQ